MQLYPLQDLHKLSPTQAHILRRIVLEVLSLAVLIAAMAAAHPRTSGENWLPDDAVGPPDVGLSTAFAGAQFRVGTSKAKPQFSPDAYNRTRNRSIQNDTRKLLRLAEALRSELNRNPGLPPTGDAAEKAKEIERLARKVKDDMKIDPNLNPSW